MSERTLADRKEDMLTVRAIVGDEPIWALSGISNCAPGSAGEILMALERDGMLRSEWNYQEGPFGMCRYRLTEMGRMARAMLMDVEPA